MNSSFSLNKILEMSLEEDEKKIFKDYVVLKVRSIKNPIMVYTVEDSIIR